MDFYIHKFTNKFRPKNRSEKVNFNYQLLEPRMLLAADISPFVAPETVWIPLTAEAIAEPGDRIHIQTTEVELFDLQEDELMAQLAVAPMEFTAEALTQSVIVSLPNPNGEFEQFEIVEAPIMAAELAERYPDIKTYRGQGIDNPAANVRISVTPLGFNASVIAPDSGDYYIDPYFHLETEVYGSYFVHEAIAQPGMELHEIGVLHEHEHEDEHDHDHEVETPQFAPPFGNQLRTYEAAIATTGEYTQFFGGTVNAGLSAVVTAMNRITQIYENDLAVRMVLVANNDQIIFTNPATDGYTNNNAGAMLSQNQSRIDSTIGSANYDIGHVFSTGGGGIAQLGVVGVNGFKAQGVSGSFVPNGDPFWVDFVAHEMGHQFDATHSFNGDSGNCAGGNRTAATAYEPGSGSSILAYAGICGNDNLQNNSDPMFHSISIDQIRAYVSSGIGAAVSTVTNTGNAIPSVNAGLNYVIPTGTPFELTATGSDANGNGSLTYSWEQRNLGPQQDVNAGDNGSSPIFRTWDPTSDPTRSFPRLTDLLNNTTVIGETLPTTNRTMSFRVVIRDNNSGGGGVRSDDMTVNVNPTGQAFFITSQNTASTSWTGGTQETITWNVAGTTSNGINTANVDIFLSTDGGLTFDTVLASNVANDGSHTITVPNVDTQNARIKVKGAGNIFYDVSNANFTVVPGQPTDGYFDVTPLNWGVLALDGATGTGYLMYSVESVHTRFASINPNNADHIVAVRLNGSQWQYTNKESTGWIDFTPTAGDVLLADVDYSNDTVTSLEGTSSVIEGIDAGYTCGDLVFTPDIWNGLSNDGEFGVAGTFFTVGTSHSSIDVTPLNWGVLALDGATGTGYLMYSVESVHTRFASINPNNADHIVAVRLNGSQWQYTNKESTGWIDFTPTAGDVLLADVDYSNDTVTSLEGTSSVIEGINAGYTGGDLVFTPDIWNGLSNDGEFGVTGTFFTVETSSGSTIDVTPLNWGVLALDSATGTGYLMYSAESVHTRFASINPNNADHILAVRLNGSQWQYTNKESTGWINFTPTAGDVLLADVDYSNDTVTSLEGTSSVIEGINAGYTGGDLVFTPDIWNGLSNDGEFGVTGTFFTVETSAGVTVDVTPLNWGVLALDGATGTGYLMYSAESVHTRFASINPNNADHIVAVRLNGSQWQYTNKESTGWINFTPTAGDVLLADVDYSNDTVTSLEGTSSVIEGINAGYTGGDLVFTPDIWNGLSNDGEFGVTGTFFEIDACSGQGRSAHDQRGDFVDATRPVDRPVDGQILGERNPFGFGVNGNGVLNSQFDAPIETAARVLDDVPVGERGNWMLIETYLKNQRNFNLGSSEVADRAFEEIRFAGNEADTNREEVKTDLDLDLAFEFGLS